MQASLELSKQLFEVSGWFDVDNYSIIPITGDGKRKKRVNIRADELCESHNHKPIPLYDLGFLIRKLPPVVTLKSRAGKRWSAQCFRGKITDDGNRIEKVDMDFIADTPEDALCRLALALFEAGILTREGQA